MITKTTAVSSGKLLVVSAMGTEALSALFDLRWMLVAVVVLIVADFWFGMSESLQKHKDFRFSRAARRWPVPSLHQR